MNKLLTIREQDFDSSILPMQENDCVLREASRAVLFDQSGRVYLMHVANHSYHKLPGGGIDEGETIQEALKREILEEVGCNAIIEDDLGMIVEYRRTPWEGLENMKQISYCYTAKQKGEQQHSALEQSELDEGMIEVKVKNVETAIKILESDKPNNLEGQFIQKRDLEFLKRAMHHSS